MSRQTLGIYRLQSYRDKRNIVATEIFPIDIKVCRDIEKNVVIILSIIQFEIVSQHSNSMSQHKIAFSISVQNYLCYDIKEVCCDILFQHFA